MFFCSSLPEPSAAPRECSNSPSRTSVHSSMSRVASTARVQPCCIVSLARISASMPSARTEMRATGEPARAEASSMRALVAAATTTLVTPLDVDER